MKIVAIIPARGNSKRIPNKNLLKVNNNHILKIVFRNLKKMSIFTDIVLTTDSKKIKKLGVKTGYDFVIDRPYNLSKDNTPSNFAIKHAINFLEKKIEFTHVCCVYPMAILFKKKHLISAFKILKKKNEIVFPAIKYSHPIQRAFKIKKNFFIKYNISKKNFLKKTQSFGEYYHDAGQFYIGSKNAWKKYHLSKKKCFKISSSEAVDVDNIDDLKNLKLKYNFINKVK